MMLFHCDWPNWKLYHLFIVSFRTQTKVPDSSHPDSWVPPTPASFCNLIAITLKRKLMPSYSHFLFPPPALCKHWSFCVSFLNISHKWNHTIWKKKRKTKNRLYLVSRGTKMSMSLHSRSHLGKSLWHRPCAHKIFWDEAVPRPWHRLPQQNNLSISLAGMRKGLSQTCGQPLLVARGSDNEDNHISVLLPMLFPLNCHLLPPTLGRSHFTLNSRNWWGITHHP